MLTNLFYENSSPITKKKIYNSWIVLKTAALTKILLATQKLKIKYVPWCTFNTALKLIPK